MELKWFAVYTRPRWEKKVAEILSKNEIENYCPLNRVERQWSDRIRIVEEPLFTSYVFVKCALPQLSIVRQLDGVVSLVNWLGKPAVIRDSEIDIIKSFLTTYKNVRLEKTAIHINDQVKILEGPLRAVQGEVLSVNKNYIRLLLRSLGYVISAEIRKENVKLIEVDRIN